MTYSGQCHCGRLKATFETQKTPQELGVRTCQCVYCRRHGAVNISDPDGLITIDGAPEDLNRYRFALRTADFCTCKTCGVYIAAVMGEGDKIVSTINITGLRMEDFFNIDEAPMDCGAETMEDRISRRFTKWTPTKFSHPELAASFFGPH